MACFCNNGSLEGSYSQYSQIVREKCLVKNCYCLKWNLLENFLFCPDPKIMQLKAFLGSGSERSVARALLLYRPVAKGGYKLITIDTPASKLKSTTSLFPL